jgi:hypothetical protein
LLAVVAVGSTAVAVQVECVMQTITGQHLQHFLLRLAQVELLARTKVTMVIHHLWEA